MLQYKITYLGNELAIHICESALAMLKLLSIAWGI